MASRIRRVFNADRIPTTRVALRIATCATIAGMASTGSCGLLLGGIHGLVISAAVTGVVGGVLGAFALTFGVVSDGTRAMGEALNLWQPVVTTEVETEAGQLSVLHDDAKGDVSLSPHAR